MMLENFRFPFSTLVGKIGGMSFCIYLLHYPIQLILDGFFINYAPVPLKHPFSVTFGLSLAGLFIPIALYLLINRSPLHRYSRYIVG
jgi:peptidoglycan/LPS O-acetylase OafA/YrhL